MHLTVILRITGTLLTLFSFAFLLPVVVGLLYGEPTLSTFFSAFAITLLSGLVLWLPRGGNPPHRGGGGVFVYAVVFIGVGLFLAK
ncbi:MAG: potassium transporter, partial [Pseudomonadota bacterium]|nr:potassium transporter [Pseudomonadota bacterium]